MRLGWTENQTITFAESELALYRVEKPHPVFAGFPWENEDQESIEIAYATLLPGQQGVAINMNRPVGGRTIAAVTTPGSVKNGPAITDYFPGTQLPPRTGSERSLVLAGHRMAFLTGSQEAVESPTLPSGHYDLTPDGETLYLNCVRYLSDPSTVTLDSLKITGGDHALAGGGILNNGANLTLNNVIVTDNDANNGGGIQTVGMLTMNRCDISNNANNPSGQSTQGAGIAIYGKLIITDTVIHSNGKGDTIGGGLKNGLTGIVTVNRSTFYSNAGDRGAAIHNSGTLDLVNTTVSGNAAQESGGGIFNFGRDWMSSDVALKGAELSLTHTTITFNTAALTGGGIFNDGNGAITLHNTINGANFSTSGPDMHYVFASTIPEVAITRIGENLLSDLTNSTLTEGPGIIVGNPMLGPLDNNGGITPTRALLAGSPAIDACSSTLIDTDQRGFPRPLGGGPDIGAYEFGDTSGYAAWAASLPSGLDTSFAGDADGDGLGNGAEYALGTDGGTFESSSPRITLAEEIESGNVVITFGYDNSAAADTAWVLKRSTNLIDYTEIYGYDGPSDSETLATGITATNDGTAITVTDEVPVETQVFYQFVAEPSS